MGIEDPNFLVRAASFYDHATAVPHQTQMMMYVWSALSETEREQALEIWRGDQTIPSTPSEVSESIPAVGLELIKEFEGYHRALPDGRAEAYADPLHGWVVPTIGYGTTKYPDGRQVQQGDIITPAQASEYLVWEVEQHCRPNLERIPTWTQMNQNQRGALYSFAYNLGPYFYGGTNFQSITRVCNTPDRWFDVPWVTAQFVKYRNPGTAAEVGLRRRREAEAALFCRPIS